MSHLAERFSRAGLDLRLVGAPFTSNPDIFALDIRRTRPHDVRTEHFIAWMGKADNTVQVQAIDKAERQLVLFVREARRSFTEDVPSWAMSRITAPIGSSEWRRTVALRAQVDPKSLVYLRGSVLDYEIQLMQHGFKFKNPNEKAACGCGESFSV